ncbi:ThiF family adenylyltransferase [Corynebacterium sp. 320]|uniref:ThiF family adenylyltransferase n=1 Tax=Corynebacterium TaxID=1716 RepID=UPI00125CAE79|nr:MULTISPECIES: ThiF family adenylyltransferase [Corynebacterium]KAB1504006.1 ThiF family adenylyltransferase [Corynebacterium sp. 320]KAB1552895.1 ThiF family adenylyltransferase [Corynebacterium sp. 321]KAB1553887.1 ThiF family adenylyltransferase [Corynebacterium sp. 319]KAB3528142.1 ThiF family adenylyltransferase [Corynebacterium sp. 250]KAB3540370.1 ThiF family adenylyltransferase [Corynebacterium sp. 366]
MSDHTELPADELKRVARQLNLPGFGMEQQVALHQAHVLIIGAGGLGCPALQQLAAAGVGRITLIDDDVVDLTNIHRQILFGAEDVGKPKVAVAAERARQLQPGIQIETVQKRLTVDNAVQLCADADLVLDGSDNFATKYLVADACEITSTPLVWGTVLRFHGDVAVWHSGANARDGRGVGLRDLFPQSPDAGSVPDCATAGVLGVTTSVIAGLMTTAAILWITGLEQVQGKVTSYEALGARFHSYTVAADPGRTLETSLGQHQRQDIVPEEHPADETVRELLNRVRSGEAVLVDIREPHEVVVDSLPPEPLGVPSVNIPLSTINDQEEFLRAWQEYDERPTVVMCASGRRSARFVESFGSLATLLDLPGGIAAAHRVLEQNQQVMHQDTTTQDTTTHEDKT